MNWLGQAHAQCSTNATDRLEARLATRSKRFVQGFAGNASLLRNQRHTSRSGKVAKGLSQQRRVILLKNTRQVRGHILFAAQILGRIKLCEFGNFDSFRHD